MTGKRFVPEMESNLARGGLLRYGKIAPP